MRWMLPLNMLERAFVLARSGEYATVNDIRARLKAERFENIDAHFAGPSLSRQLRSLCVEARRDAPPA